MDKRSTTRIADKAALLKYYWGFKVQADNILDLALLEFSELFMPRIPQVIEGKLRKQLCIKFPNTYPTDPFPLKYLYESTKWLYKGGLGFGRTVLRDAYCWYNNSGAGYDRREEKHEERKEVVVKTEPVDYMAMTEAIKGLTNMMTMLTQNQLNTGVLLRVPDQFPRPLVNVFVPASTFVQPAPSTGLAGFTAPPPTGCRFCRTPGHFIRECPAVEEYQRSRKAIRNRAGQVTLPNGAFIP